MERTSQCEGAKHRACENKQTEKKKQRSSALCTGTKNTIIKCYIRWWNKTRKEYNSENVACSGVIIDPLWMYMMWKQSSLHTSTQSLVRSLSMFFRFVLYSFLPLCISGRSLSPVHPSSIRCSAQTVQLTMENVRRALPTTRYPNTRFDSILYSVRWTISLARVEEYIFFLSFSFFFSLVRLLLSLYWLWWLGEKDDRVLRVQITYIHTLHSRNEHMNIETEQPYFLITYVMCTLENKFDAPAPFIKNSNWITTKYSA